MASFNTIFKEWENSKTTLFKMLGNQLIVRRPYTYVIPEQNLIDTFTKKKYDNDCWTFLCWWNREIIAPLTNQTNIDPEFLQLCYDIIKPATLAENKYLNNTKLFLLPPDNESFKVSKGMRPMRIITKLAQKYGCNEDILEKFRIWHSQILNNKHMDGELCLSIHPLDFMTMSDNDNDWQSCMNWINHGDYRAGTIECMNSPYILMAYLHNPKHKMTFGSWNEYEWNSKHWRELFIIYPEMMTEIKGYCFQDENLTNTVLMWIKELAHNNLNWDYDNDEINLQDTTSIPFNEGDLCFRVYPEGYMYNDIGTLDKHRARINREKIGKYENITHWLTPSDEKWHYMLELPYGGKATCMWCGREFNDPDREEFVFCDNCDPSTRCSYCGNYMREEDGYYIEDYDGLICSECLDYECGIDDLTDETHINSNLDYIEWLIGYDEDNNPIFYDEGIWVYHPKENYKYKELFSNPPKTMNRYYSHHQYITVDDIINKNEFEEVFRLDDNVENIIAEYIEKSMNE